MRALCFASCLLLVGITTPSQAENWPQWRGAKWDGISQEQNLPTTWSQTENVAWRVKLPGPGGATPVVWGDRIFVTSVEGSDLVLLGISTSGKELWKQTVGSGNKDVRGDEGNFASPTPSTDGKHVWAFFGNGSLGCYTVEGKEVWRFEVPERYGKFNIAFGLSSTPVLDKGRLYLQLIHGDGNPKTREAKVVCLNAADGSEIWAVERESDGSDENEHSYASPTIYRDGTREYLLTHGCDYVVAHDLKDGKEIWRCGELNSRSRYDRTLRFVASPVCVPGMIVVPSAKGGPVFCLKPDGKGDITEDESKFFWKFKRTPDVPSPLIHKGLVYLCMENGNLTCLEGESGAEVYANQRTEAHRHRASPVLADGKLYLTARNGVVTVVKAGREFEILSRNDMKDSISASPAIANGRIYIRSFDALYAIGEGKEGAAK